MKKIILILGIFLFLYLYNSKEYNISDDMIRFRVIAHSNANRDILMKELVVKELSNVLFVNNNNINDARKNIYSNLESIDKRIKKVFKENNYNKKYNISYGLNEIPEKKFMGNIYKEGIYESLVIEIGDAKGDNYFCVLYPSLCMIDYNKKSDIKFKIVEVFNKLF